MTRFRFSSEGLVRSRGAFAAQSHPVARYARAHGRKGRRIVIPRSAPALRFDCGRIVRGDPLR
jgi:hypothetical protein